MATVPANIALRAARSQGVVKARRALAKEIGARATALLAEHRANGSHRIRVTHARRDSFVTLEGPGAVSVEFGRDGYTRDDGRHVGPMTGLRILTRAMRG